MGEVAVARNAPVAVPYLSADLKPAPKVSIYFTE
jgi:hypothetical protein